MKWKTNIYKPLTVHVHVRIRVLEMLVFQKIMNAHVRVQIRGLEMLVFRKVMRTYQMDDTLSFWSISLTR